MIGGTVSAAREAVIRVTMRESAGRDSAFDAVIDTGFTGFLTLPSADIVRMGLLFAGHEYVLLGDGTMHLVEVYTGLVVWDGVERTVEVDAAETNPLVGMSLLYGYRLTMEAVDGGSVAIEAL